MVRNSCKNIRKDLSSKYSQKLLDYAEQQQPATDAIKTASEEAVQQKTAEATGDLIENKIADKITRASKNSQQNNSETKEKEIFRERFRPAVLRDKIVDDLRLKT